jgi:hypothetical protein
MKKISRYFLMATVSLSMFAQNAFAADQTGVCKLISELEPVIRTLRILAFLGAAFVLMDWAWGFIKSGEVKKDDLKDKGIGMFVGFFLLFGVGLILTFVASTGGQSYLGCVKDAFAVTKA